MNKIRNFYDKFKDKKEEKLVKSILYCLMSQSNLLVIQNEDSKNVVNSVIEV